MAIDFSKRIRKEPPPSPIDDTNSYLIRNTHDILLQTDKITRLKQINYHPIYSIDTSLTTRRKIDLIADIGLPSYGLAVLSSGGGFDIEIGDEGEKFRASTNTIFIDELIERVYVTGYGKTGTGKIRFEVIR